MPDTPVPDQVLRLIADAIDTADVGLAIEDPPADNPDALVISWPLDTAHPQPPDVPTRMRVILVEEP